MRSAEPPPPRPAPPAPAARAVAPPVADAAPAYETEVELDPGNLEDLGNLDLAEAPEFDVDAPPAIGGDAEFSEGDFAGESDDPNAKTQPELQVDVAAPGAAASGPSAASAAAAGPTGDADLFGDAGTDLSLFDDDDER
jgi:hypothetical protein